MTYTDEDMKRMENLLSVEKSTENSIIDNPKVVGHDDKFIYLENIVCHDSLGSAIESYDYLMVSKKALKDDDHDILNLDLDWVVMNFEDKGLFLPSLPLTCKVLTVIGEAVTEGNIHETDQELYNALFDHMQEYFNTTKTKGIFMQNTLVDYKNYQVIHYPAGDDMKQTVFDMNSKKERTVLHFPYYDPKNDQVMRLGLEDEIHHHFMKNLTGVDDPMRLVEAVESTCGINLTNLFVRTLSRVKEETGIGFTGSDGSRSYIMTCNTGNITLRGYKEII